MKASLKSPFLLPALALVMAAALPAVKAGTIIESLPCSGSWVNGWLPQFNPTNGQLTNVTLQFGCNVAASGGVYNPTPNSSYFILSIVGGGASMSVSNLSIQFNYQGVGGAGGFVAAGSSTPATVTGEVYGNASTSKAADLNFFTGSNSVYVSVITAPAVVSVMPPGLEFMSGGGSATLTNAGLTYYYAPPSRPALTISSSGANVILTWPTNAAGFTLQSTTDLSLASWNPVSPAPVVLNTNNVVTNAISGTQQFYRLSQ